MTYVYIHCVVVLCILPNSQKRNVLKLYACIKTMTWTSITEKKKRSIDLSDSKDYSTWQSHLHGFDVQIRFKRIRWFPQRIPEHPSVLISKDTARNKACQTIYVRHRHIPEACMEPCEYRLTTGKRMITWIDLTNVHTNDKSTQTKNLITVNTTKSMLSLTEKLICSLPPSF